MHFFCKVPKQYKMVMAMLINSLIVGPHWPTVRNVLLTLPLSNEPFANKSSKVVQILAVQKPIQIRSKLDRYLSFPINFPTLPFTNDSTKSQLWVKNLCNFAVRKDQIIRMVTKIHMTNFNVYIPKKIIRFFVFYKM